MPPVRPLQRIRNGVKRRSSAEAAFESAPPHQVAHAANRDGTDRVLAFGILVLDRKHIREELARFNLQRFHP